MKNLFFLIFACAMLATTASAQYRIELPSVRGQNPDSVVSMLNRHDIQWQLAGSRTGKNPIGEECADNKNCITTYRHPVLEGVKIGPQNKEGWEAPVLPLPTLTPPINVVCEGDTVINIINVTVSNSCCDTATKKSILAIAETIWFGEANAMLPTDNSYSFVTPAIELGFEISGRLEEHPGLLVFFEANVTSIPAAFIKQETCPSCVPQAAKTTIGAQIGTGLTWQVGKKLALTGSYKSKVWMPTERKVESLPGDGWGCRLTFGKPNAAVKWQIGTTASREAGTAPYIGLRLEMGHKKNSRVLFQPAKLTRRD